MFKQLFFLFFGFLYTIAATAQEPSFIQLSPNGKIEQFTYDFNGTEQVYPLTKLTVNRNGGVSGLTLAINDKQLWVDAKGRSSFRTLQVPFKIELNSNNSIDRIKKNHQTLYRFYYDFDGNLEKIKDEDFNVLFALRYNFDGSLDKIDKGNFDYYARFYYGENNRLEGIKNDDFNYVWKIYYGTNHKIEKIKDANYNVRVEMDYTYNQLTNISKYNSNTTFKVGYPTQNQYGQSQYGQQYYNPYNNGNCNQYGQNGPVVTFFSNANYQGNSFSYGLGNFGQFPSNWQNCISSIVIPQGVCVIVYEHSNFCGASLVIDQNWSCAYWGDFWNNRISSVRVVYR